MKNNFVIRTGKGSGINVADEIEKKLREAKMLPSRKIPRSNLNRLLSAETLRNRLGISVRKGRLDFIRDEPATLRALQRVASDLATRVVTLDDIWDTESKLGYIDKLDAEGILPGVARTPRLPVPTPAPPSPPRPGPAPPKPPAAAGSPPCQAPRGLCPDQLPARSSSRSGFHHRTESFPGMTLPCPKSSAGMPDSLHRFPQMPHPN